MASEARIPNQGPKVTDIFSAFREGIAQLARQRVTSAAFTAELLMLHVLGRERAWFYAHPESELDAAAREKYFSLIAQRAGGVLHATPYRPSGILGPGI